MKALRMQLRKYLLGREVFEVEYRGKVIGSFIPAGEEKVAVEKVLPDPVNDSEEVPLETSHELTKPERSQGAYEIMQQGGKIVKEEPGLVENYGGVK